jgi:tetratricopeptide (TPR) repeat protein
MKGGLLEEIDIVSSLENFFKASTLSHGTELVTALTRIAYNFYNSGYPDKGNYYMKEAGLLESDSVPYCYKTCKILADTRGEYGNAAEYSGKRLKNDPGNIILLRDLGYYYCLAGDYTESLKYYKQYVDLYNSGMRSSPFLNRFTYLGFVFKQNGFTKDADYYFEKQIEVYSDRLRSILPTERIYWTYPLAGIYAARGNKDKAIEYLKMFSRNSSYTLSWVTLLENDPAFSGIRNDPEFREIVKDVETKYQAQHEKVGKWLEDKGR